MKESSHDLKKRIQENSNLLLVMLVALIVRLLYFRYVIPVDFHIDAYHHWQISYFSLKIGFPRFGFFYDPGAWMQLWLPLPHIIQMALLVFDKTMIPMRMFNTLIGTLTIIPIYRLSRLIGGKNTGTLAGLMYAVFPTIAATDVQALIEPFTIFLVFWAFLKMYEEKDLQAGVLWGLACLCRVEIWVLAFCTLFAAYVFQKQNSNRISKLLVGVTPILLMYYVFFTVNGFTPHETFIQSFLKRIQNTKPFSLYILIVALGITFSIGILFLCLKKEKGVYKTLMLRSNRIKNTKLLPIYVFILLYFTALFFDAFRYENFLYKIWKLVTFSKPRFIDTGIFRYSTIPFSVSTVPFSVLIIKPEKSQISKYASLITVFSLIILNAPIGAFYAKYQSIPESYIEPSNWIKENWDGKTIVIDNQFMIHQLTGAGHIPPEKILGSYWAQDLTQMKEKNVTQIVFTSIPWDGANRLYNKVSDGNFKLVYSQKVADALRPFINQTVYIYKIQW